MAQGTSPLSDVFRNNILFRLRAGQNVSRATYTRASTATYANQNSVLIPAASGNLRVEWVDLDGDGVRETPSYLFEGARTQKVTDPENFTPWTNFGTPIVTSGQADPFGGTAGYLVEDDNAASPEGRWEVVPFTGDGIKAIGYHVRQNTAAAFSLALFDNTAASYRIIVIGTWNAAGVPVLSINTGAGSLFTPQRIGNWWWVTVSANGVIAANTNQTRFFAADIANAPVGKTYFFGANAWDAPYPASYQGPSGGATVRAADAYSVPFNWSPCDCTVLARVARPLHADATGTLGQNPRIFEIGTASSALIGNFNSTARQFVGQIDTPTTDATQTASIPAGTSLTTTWQFKNLTTGGSVAIDTGTGLSAFSSAATAFSAFGNQTLRIGGSGGDELYGGLMDLLIVRGLLSRDRMIQLAGIL